ncbi:methionine synthase reductase-like isoform X2 [Dysidea avara]|uniref:methionine synthase reductase-like isoform X2 n=1 Tax=Dysidea avara TaxID=196820 RepID=UPI003320EBD1
MKRILLVYGSQTGQSQAISEQIAEAASLKGFQVDLHCLDQSGVKFHLEQEPVIVIVCSSTGDGDPPDNAAKFWRKLKKRTLPEDHLAKCHYTVLGLGDSNYSKFCNMGKLLDERMNSLGATRFYDAGFADDAVGLEAVVEPWIEGLWNALSSLFDQNSNEMSKSPSRSNTRILPEVAPAKPLRTQNSNESILSSPDELRFQGICSPTPSKQLDTGPGPESLLVPNFFAKERRRSGSLPAAITIDITNPDEHDTELRRTFTVSGLTKKSVDGKRKKDVVDIKPSESFPPILSRASLTTSPRLERRHNGSPIMAQKKFTTAEEGTSPSHQLVSPVVPSSPLSSSPPLSPRNLRSAKCSSPVLPRRQPTMSLPRTITADAVKFQVDKGVEKPVFYSPQLPRSRKLDSSPSHTKRASTLKKYYSVTQESSPPSHMWTGYSQGSLKPIDGRESSNENVEARKKILAGAADIVNGVIVQRRQQLPKIKQQCVSSPSLGRHQTEVIKAPTLASTDEEGPEQIGSGNLSLQKSNSGLEYKELNLPSFQPPFLHVEVKKPSGETLPYPVLSVPYTTASHLYTSHLVTAKQVTSDDAVKRTMHLSFKVEAGSDGEQLSYEPGDAFGFVCPNNKEEVNYLLERLSLMSMADYEVHLQILSETRKKNPVIPKHIPSYCTIRQFFTHCAAIRSIPKKAFLFMLSQYTDNEKEKRRLEELCSKQGASEYTHLFIEYHLDLLDVLNAFPSCAPPLPRLIEFLPRLQPRYYSVASSPDTSPSHFDIVFNVEHIPDRDWMSQQRHGLCTGWLAELAQRSIVMTKAGESSVDPPQYNDKVTIFSRLLNPFHLPADPSLPLIMVGPGTGVAPYIGFLQHRRSLKSEQLGPSWLFYGCRHPLKDYLFKKELASYVADGTLTHLLVSFSRYDDISGHHRYVQDSIRAKGKQLAEAIMEQQAVIYVCGDARNMSRDIKEAFMSVLSEYFHDKATPVATAEEVLTTMQEDRRYILDIWA